MSFVDPFLEGRCVGDPRTRLSVEYSYFVQALRDGREVNVWTSNAIGDVLLVCALAEAVHRSRCVEPWRLRRVILAEYAGAEARAHRSCMATRHEGETLSVDEHMVGSLREGWGTWCGAAPLGLAPSGVMVLDAITAELRYRFPRFDGERITLATADLAVLALLPQDGSWITGVDVALSSLARARGDGRVRDRLKQLVAAGIVEMDPKPHLGHYRRRAPPGDVGRRQSWRALAQWVGGRRAYTTRDPWVVAHEGTLLTRLSTVQP